MRQYVTAKRLLEVLWHKGDGPSLRWLRKQQQRRTIPWVKLGGRVFFVPALVDQELRKRWTIERR